MSTLVGSIGDSSLMTKAALLFGVCALLASVAQLALLRRFNLIPAIAGLIATTFFANVLGQTMGLIHGFLAAGAATPQERQVLFGADMDRVMNPMLWAFILLIVATLVATVTATIRANLGPSTAPQREAEDPLPR